MQIPDGTEGTLRWNANTAYKHGHKNQCKIKEFIYLLKKAISKYLYEKWPCMALIGYLWSSERLKAIALLSSLNLT